MMVGRRCSNRSLPTLMEKKGGSKLANDLTSPGSADIPKHVVIVMDGLKEFTFELLEWVLENIIVAGHIVTLLGFMPWLNIPLSSKTWQDVWMLEFEHLDVIKEKKEWKNDAKYLKLQAVVDLCKRHGVMPQKEIVMGYPLPLLVVERIINLRATWVVFDSNRELRKKRKFFAEKIPCNMVMLNEEGDMDMIKGRPMIDNYNYTPSPSSSCPPNCPFDSSPASLAPTPLIIFPEPLKRILEEEDDQLEKYDDD